MAQSKVFSNYLVFTFEKVRYFAASHERTKPVFRRDL